MPRLTMKEIKTLEAKGLNIQWNNKSKNITNVKWVDKKYNSNSSNVDWLNFRSQLERKRYDFLIMLKKLWKIKDVFFEPKKFVLQEWFKYNWNTYKKITYTPDFQIVLNNWMSFWEDTKSESTRKKESYRLKMKMFIKNIIVNNDTYIDFKEVLNFDDIYFLDKIKK